MSKSSFTDMKNPKECGICWSTIKQGDGEAVFTAGCLHSFHFQCIYGNKICPICRAKWNEIPLTAPSFNPPPHLSRNVNVNSVHWSQSFNLWSRNVNPMDPEPAFFNDDESVDDHQSVHVEENTSGKNLAEGEQRKLKINIYTELLAVPRSKLVNDFSVLINLKAPAPIVDDEEVYETGRARIDLVTVLDVSISMKGTKLALLKRAMGFVIQNLGPNDRLAVITFASTARRVFPLRRMSEIGRQDALEAVNSLITEASTNIAEGLRKGAKVMEDRREKNTVSGIVLLSDGQDNYTFQRQDQRNYQLLLPFSNTNSNLKIPVHTFGFGTDHDASLMHSISEISGGTFSFIENESTIQDAFAQCIGGLLSVTVKDLQVSIESVNSNVKIGSLKSGSYNNHITPDGHLGTIVAGDLYAEEERDFLVTVNVPTEASKNQTTLLKVRCFYNNPLTKESVILESDEVRIQRPDEVTGDIRVSAEVDRQRNRLSAADAMALARTAAEKGDLARAKSILENCRKAMSETVSANDQLCVGLDAELKEIQEKMASVRVYEGWGRAHILTGMSSHLQQRAAFGACGAKGGSTGAAAVPAYQTSAMAKMVNRSQATAQPKKEPRP